MPGYRTIDTDQEDIELYQMAPDDEERAGLGMPVEQPEFSVPALVMLFIVTFFVAFWIIWFLASPPTSRYRGGGGSDGDSGWLL